jgi:NAD(P)-dependent dehydrogenase (short-subunit alcohol dehydrogenase family)
VGLLDGQHAIVTGCASGIGRATCRRMHEEGARVAVVDLNADAAEQVAKEIEGLAYAVDVTDYDALQQAVDDTVAHFGGLTTVFNNAGAGSMSQVHDWTIDEWNRLVAINLGGVFHGIKATVPHLMAGGGGSIVSTASISGTRPSAGEAPYSAAKAGVVALTANAAHEYAPTVRVNAVSPGMIRTALTDVLLSMNGMVEHMEAKTPLGRIGTPNDVADVVVFLSSDLARFMTGQNLVVDGGMTLHGAGVDGLLERFRPFLQNPA